MKGVRLFAAAMAIMIATPAAATTVLTVSGTVDELIGIYDPPIESGDAFTLTATYDFDKAVIGYTSPTQREYLLPNTAVTLTIVTSGRRSGELIPYSSSFTTTAAIDLFQEMSDNELFFEFLKSGLSADDVPPVGFAGNTAFTSDIIYIAYGGKFLSSFDLADIPQPSVFSHQLARDELTGEQTGKFGVIEFNVSSVSLVTRSVPEPDTWVMMIVGLGALGAALRRRHARTGIISGRSAAVSAA